MGRRPRGLHSAKGGRVVFRPDSGKRKRRQFGLFA